MKEERQRWKDFKAYLCLTATDFKQIQRMAHKPEIIGTRWVFTWKVDGTTGKRMAKARLVAQGCQEISRGFRTDSPTASRTGFYLTLLAAVQNGWTLESYDARTAFLQSGQITRELLFKLPKGDLAPPGMTTDENQVVWANGSVYGTRDAGRAWYVYLRHTLVGLGFRERMLEHGLY